MGFRERFSANLPANPDEALLLLADRAMDWLEDESSGNYDLEGIIICSMLEAFILRFRPDISVAKSTDEGQVKDYVEAIMRNVGQIHVERILEAYEESAESHGKAFGRAELTSEEKASLHQHLENLRKIIETSSLSVRKKNGLFDRLNALQAEIDLHGTRTDRFFAFASDLGFYAGEFTKRSAPFWNEVKEVLRIVTKARARDEGIELPPGDEILGLPNRKSNDGENSGENNAN
jgi:hypothetical protein